MFAMPELLGGTGDILIGNLIKEQFLDNRDWPLGAALRSCSLLPCAAGGWRRRAFRRSSLHAEPGADKTRLLALGGVAGDVYAFLYLPLAVVVLFSFNDSNSTPSGSASRRAGTQAAADEEMLRRRRQLAADRHRRSARSPPCSARWPASRCTAGTPVRAGCLSWC
jgi:hypothetical protein